MRACRKRNGMFCSSYHPAPQMATRRPRTGLTGLGGRRAQAARNDRLIVNAARAVFVADPEAPISAVARRAGVGISAVYSRYGSKEALLRALCQDALRVLVHETEAALADSRDPWTVFADYMRRVVDADTSSLTLALAGGFTPTSAMNELAQRANRLTAELFKRFAPVLRPGVEVHDLSLVFELVAAVKLPDPQRTATLRRRYLAVILDGLRPGAGTDTPLPGPAPSWLDLYAR
jgi:AcrR family transcriptional regulator